MTTPLWRRYLRFWGADPAADVDDEFAFHLEMRIEELRAHGLSPEAARDEAHRGFGNIQDVKSICRTLADEREHAMRRTQWWSDWRHDCRFAVRQLTVSPVLTAVLVVTIALGIGSTVAIFSVLNAVLLRPLRAPTTNASSGSTRLAAVTYRKRVGRPLPRLDRARHRVRRHGGGFTRLLQPLGRRARASQWHAGHTGVLPGDTYRRSARTVLHRSRCRAGFRARRPRPWPVAAAVRGRPVDRRPHHTHIR